MLRKIMTIVLIVFGVLCLLYFVILLAKHVHFCEIWLLLAVLSAGTGTYLRNLDMFRLPSIAEKGFLLLIFSGVIIFSVVEMQIISAMEKTNEKVDAIIVLGAQVKGTVPSKALRLRLESAQKWMQENPEVMAVLSGGQGDGEEISEAQCMYEYLVQHGICSERLILEDQSTTTKENLIFSKKLLGDTAHLRIGLVTNNFHVYRAVKFARNLGYEHVSGIPAKSDPRLQIHYMVREFFALIKEFAV